MDNRTDYAILAAIFALVFIGVTLCNAESPVVAGTGVTLEDQQAEVKGKLTLFADWDWMYDRISDHGNDNGGEAGEVMLWSVMKHKDYLSLNFGYSASDRRLFFAPMLDANEALERWGGDSWDISIKLAIGAHVNYDMDDRRIRYGIAGGGIEAWWKMRW